MDTEQFAYWLQGFAEISNNKRPSEKQWAEIRKRLSALFNKETPDRYLTVGMVGDKADTGTATVKVPENFSWSGSATLGGVTGMRSRDNQYYC